MQKLSQEIVVGDVLELPGWMLHEDLSGLNFEITVIDVTIEPKWVYVQHTSTDDHVVTTAFRTHESVRCLKPAS